MGVYVHIPFCRSKCYYCGFYSVASIVFKQAFIRALCREIELRKDYLGTYKPETLYLGGGTPSYLTPDELQIILQKLEEIHPLSLSAERTIEMNPEDLVPAKLNELRRLGFNRLSIGVQTFNEKGLKKMNRAHTARQAIDGIFCAAESGFENIGIDFIIGMPGNTLENIKADLKQIQYLHVSHVSVYILSIEEGSVFA
ncbi:MAG: radical SAM protein, partial [Odoribacter sp.]|nr:radical SAM protein [Odoribacter sp.]